MTTQSAIRIDRELKGVAGTEQLVRELDTDWFPDPWSWAFPELASETPIRSFQVPFPGGPPRRVPVVGFAHRLRFARAATEVVRNTQETLTEGVFGFRVGADGVFRHYRDELRRRAAFERSTSKDLPHVATTDVRSFFRSVTIGHIAETIGAHSPANATADLIAILQQFKGELGYPLPEGHGASRGVASLVLLPVDQTIKSPFARWLDDYRVFTGSHHAATTQLARLTDALEAFGFTVASEKTVAATYGTVNSDYAASLADHAPNEAQPLSQTLHQSGDSVRGWEKSVRLALRMAADHPRPSDLQVVGENLEHIPTIAYPRLAWLLLRHKDAMSAWDILHELLNLESEMRDWRILRMLPLLWYFPKTVARNASNIVEEAFKKDGPLRLMAVRVAVKQMPSMAQSWLDELSERERLLVALEIESHGRPRSSTLALESDPYSLTRAMAGPPVHSYL